MKRLYLLRCAQHRADQSAKLAEYHLPLTRRGELEAAGAGKYMQKKNYAPDLIICASPARARQTLANMWPYLHSAAHNPELIFDYRIHLTRGDGLLAQLQHLDKRHAQVLLLGTAPGISELAGLIIQPPDDISGASSLEIPPGGLMVFDCAISAWNELAPAGARLLERRAAKTS